MSHLGQLSDAQRACEVTPIQRVTDCEDDLRDPVVNYSLITMYRDWPSAAPGLARPQQPPRLVGRGPREERRRQGGALPPRHQSLRRVGAHGGGNCAAEGGKANTNTQLQKRWWFLEATPKLTFGAAHLLDERSRLPGQLLEYVPAIPSLTSPVCHRGAIFLKKAPQTCSDFPQGFQNLLQKVHSNT